MRSRWEGGGDGKGVTLFGWVEEEEEKEEEEEGQAERWNREGAVRSIIHNFTQQHSYDIQRC